MSQAQLAPFRSAAARHRTSSYTYTFTPGQPINIPLNRQGYLSELQIKLEGTVNVGTAGTAQDPYATINFFPSIGIRSPQGDYLVSLSSRSLFHFQNRFRDNTLDALPAGQTLAGIQRPDARMFNPTIAGSQAVDISWRIPISMNLGSSFETGMLLTQLANNDFYLQLGCATQNDLIGTGTAQIPNANITLTVYVEATWFELVDPQLVMPPDIHSVCKLRDSLTPLIVGGDNYISYQLGPVLMDQMLEIITNQTGDTSNGANFNYIKMLVNRSIEIENRRGKDVYRDNFYNLGKQLPPGVFLLNFFDDWDGVFATRARDFINSNAAAQLDTIVNVNPATTLSGARITSTYRELVTLGA